jgi:hypothetical protein
MTCCAGLKVSRAFGAARKLGIRAAQQVAGADHLIESPFVVRFRFAAVRVVGDVTAKPGGGSAPSR